MLFPGFIGVLDRSFVDLWNNRSQAAASSSRCIKLPKPHSLAEQLLDAKSHPPPTRRTGQSDPLWKRSQA